MWPAAKANETSRIPQLVTKAMNTLASKFNCNIDFPLSFRTLRRVSSSQLQNPSENELNLL